MYRRGFTIVELVIVITIMGILLVLGVVNLRSTQANARDDERKTDIESLALQLESFYTSGNDDSTTFGRYPSTGIIGMETTILRDIDPKTLRTPGASAVSLVAATNATQTPTGVTPSATTSTYIYQPLQSNGALCTSGAQECRKFNLFYRLEVAAISDSCPSPGLACMVTSKNQ